MNNAVFVFGSNEAGVHGAGAALHAVDKGAKKMQGFGPAGMTFAIPTKDWDIRQLSLDVIRFYVDRFIAYAEKHPNIIFQVTAIGCGLAGYSHSDIAPMFKHAPRNCFFDEAWSPYLREGHNYWGTF